MKSHIFLFFILISSSTFAHKGNCDFSKMNSRSQFWLSATLTKSGDFDLIPLIVKKWEMKDQSLQEITSNSVGLDDQGKKVWKSENVSLKTPAAFEKIAGVPLQLPACKYLEQVRSSAAYSL